MLSRLYQTYASRVSALSLFQKLAIKTLLIAVIPLLLTTALFLRQANRIIAEETALSNERAFLQTVALINGDLQMNKRALSTYVTMPQVIEALTLDPMERTVFEQAMDLRDLLSDTLIIGLTDLVFRLRIYVPDQFFYAREHVNTFPLSEIVDEPWYKDIGRYAYVYLPVSENYYIYNQRRRVLSIAAGIQPYKLSNEILGVAMVDVDLDVLRTMLNAQVRSSSSVLCIVGEDSIILETGDGASGSPFAGQFPEKLEALAKTGQSGLRMGDWYVQWSDLEIPEWRLVEAIPMEKMESGARRLLLQVSGIGLLVMGLVVVVTLLTSRAFTERIRRMAMAVNRFEAGEHNARLVVGSGDVLGSFEQDLNHLFDRVNKLMADCYALGRQAKSADMNALQSQINPHFLYNTLDMLYWMAKKGEFEKVPEVVVALSGFYRKSLSRGRALVRVADELEHVRLYLEIQKCRFGETIDVAWNVDETLIDAPIMKLTLQPIVENAVQHGMGRRVDNKGRIEITVCQNAAEELKIVVADNGAGMTPEQAQALTQGDWSPSKDEGGSYGIYNVQRRLRLLYGEAYGLTYDSVLGQGTAVSVRIPLQSFPPEDGKA